MHTTLVKFGETIAKVLSPLSDLERGDSTFAIVSPLLCQTIRKTITSRMFVEALKYEDRAVTLVKPRYAYS